MEQPQPFHVQSGDCTVLATFQVPAFHLLVDSAGLFHRLYGELSEHGLQVDDMKIMSADSSLGDVHLQCVLFGWSAILRVRVAGVELWYDITRVARATADDVFRRATLAVQDHLSKATIKTWGLTLRQHGQLPGTTSAEYLGRFIRSVPALGSLAGSGAIFYFTPEADRLAGSLVVDLSARTTPPGLFVEARTIWDARKIALETLPEREVRYAEELMRHLGLHVGA